MRQKPGKWALINEAAEKTGLNPSTLYNRMRTGITLEEACAMGSRKRHRDPLALEAIARGMTTSTLHARKKAGIPLEEACAMPVRKYRQDLVGQTFERLTVKAHAGRTKSGKDKWLCLCSCGKEKVVIGADLKSRQTLSCGCLASERARERALAKYGDITGQKFGDIEVLRQSGTKLGGSGGDIRVYECLCPCGKKFDTTAYALKAGVDGKVGGIKSCGCLHRENMRKSAAKRAHRFDVLGANLTISEITELTNVDGPTFRYRVNTLGMTPSEAALNPPLRKKKDT